MGGSLRLIFLQLDPYPLASIDASKHSSKPPLRNKLHVSLKGVLFYPSHPTNCSWMCFILAFNCWIWIMTTQKNLVYWLKCAFAKEMLEWYRTGDIGRTHLSLDLLIDSAEQLFCVRPCVFPDIWVWVYIPGRGLLYLTNSQASSLSGIWVQAGETEIWAHKRLKFSIFDCFFCVLGLLQWVQPDEFSLN